MVPAAATPVAVPSASRSRAKLLCLMVKESLWVFAPILCDVILQPVAMAVFNLGHPTRLHGLIFLRPAFSHGFGWLASEVYFCATRTRQQAATRQERRFLVASSIASSLALLVLKFIMLMMGFFFSSIHAVRSLAPAIVMGISSQFFGKTFSKSRKFAVALMVMGMALACNYAIREPVSALALLALHVVLTASKEVLDGEMLAGDMEMSPVQLVSRLAPLGLAQSLFLAFASGEVTELVHNSASLDRILIEAAVLAPVVIAVRLCLLQATKVTSPLTMNITYRVYTVLGAGYAEAMYWFWDHPISGVRKLGFVVVVAATICYAVLSVAERLRPLRQAPDPSPSTELIRRTLEGGVADAKDDMRLPLLEAKVQSTASQQDGAACTVESGR